MLLTHDHNSQLHIRKRCGCHHISKFAQQSKLDALCFMLYDPLRALAAFEL